MDNNENIEVLDNNSLTPKESQIAQLRDLQDNLYKYFINYKTILNMKLSRDDCVYKRDYPDVHFEKGKSHELEKAKKRIEKERMDNAKVLNTEKVSIISVIVLSLLMGGIIVLFLLNAIEGILNSFPFLYDFQKTNELLQKSYPGTSLILFWFGMIMLEIRIIIISVKRIKVDYDIVGEHIIIKVIYWIIILLFMVKNLAVVFSLVDNFALLIVFFLLLIVCVFVREIVEKSSDIIYDNSIKETKLHKQQLIEAGEQDRINNEEYQKMYEKEVKEWEEKGKQEYQQDMQKQIDGYQKEIDKSHQELEKADKAINENNIIADSEKEIDIVEKLLYFLESGRADNIKEALNLYDTAKSRDELAGLQRVQNDISRNGFDKMSNLLNEQINIQNNILETQTMFMEQNHADMMELGSKMDNMSTSLNNISNKITDYASISSSQRAVLSSQLSSISGKISSISNVQRNAALNEYVSDYFK